MEQVGKLKILLSYSKTHFNPTIPREQNKLYYSSAAINARTLFEVLSELGDVEYIDFSEWESVKNKSFDLFVGINHNFDNILKIANIKKSIYYSVNCHPTYRNALLEGFKAPRKLQNRALNRFLHFIRLNRYFNVDWRRELAPEVENLSNVDSILTLGNDIIKNSYIEQGISPDKISTISYEIDKGQAQYKPNFSDKPAFLYVATEACLRKGFDLVLEFANYLQNKDCTLTILAASNYAFYRQKIKKDLKYKNVKVIDKGLNGEKYYNLIKEHDFYIFPSLEEGQAGTVLDAMFFGLIPIITQESGTDFSPLGFLQPTLNSKHNYDILEKALELSRDEKIKLSNETTDYYNKNHFGFKDRLRTAIKNIIEDSCEHKQ